MNITIESKAKPCPGVERAIALVEDNLRRGEKIFSVGNLIHNRREVERLENLGLQMMTEDELHQCTAKKMPSNAGFLVRCHGETNITLDAFGKRNFAATIRRIACYVLDLEKQARTVEVEAEFTNQEDLLELLAGYSADVEIVLERKKGVLRVPTEAVMEDNKVLLLTPEEGILQERKIEVGISNWKFSEITKGLQAGDQILLSVDKEGVSDGVKVNVGHENKP